MLSRCSRLRAIQIETTKSANVRRADVKKFMFDLIHRSMPLVDYVCQLPAKRAWCEQLMVRHAPTLAVFEVVEVNRRF